MESDVRALGEPCANNDYLSSHIQMLTSSLLKLSGRALALALAGETPAMVAQSLYEAPFVVLSHDVQADPIFNYGNRAAQRLFEVSWSELTAMPSRYSAASLDRAERERLLARVSAQGYIDDYSGIRIARSGRRFLVRDAVVWNVYDARGTYRGQAAMFSEWTMMQ